MVSFLTYITNKLQQLIGPVVQVQFLISVKPTIVCYWESKSWVVIGSSWDGASLIGTNTRTKESLFCNHPIPKEFTVIVDCLTFDMYDIIFHD